MVMADALKRGYKVAIPLGEDWRYDLIVEKAGILYKIQCKYVESKNKTIKVRCESHDGRNYYKYRQEDLDYIAVYDNTTGQCYYIEKSLLNLGRASITLRLNETKNGQKKKILNAKDFLEF